MAALQDFACPTLAQADQALADGQPFTRRAYLGMSAIGGACERALWYQFRWVATVRFDAVTLKRFADGHASEAVAVHRLKLTPGLEVHDVDASGDQFGFRDFGGHFAGHMDGVCLGLVQAPKAWHVLEIKASEKWQDLDKARKKVGEKSALAEWNSTYYAQAVLYMDYARLDRHYLVCVSPGARRWTAVRTNADPVHANALKAKAERIIFADTAPQRIGGPDSFACRFCDFSAQCHEGVRAERNCRNCLAVEVSRDGGWRCTRFGHELSRADQEAGCPEHRFLPDLVAGEQVDVIHGQVVYRLRDGSRWVDGGPRVHSIGDIIKRQACRSCGSLSWKVTEGAGPHAAGLRCLSCDTDGGWLQKAEVVA